MECKYCGRQNDENNKFCEFCGLPLEQNENSSNEIVIQKNNIVESDSSIFIDQNNVDYIDAQFEEIENVSEIDTYTKKASIISICIYFFVFYFLSSIISSILLVITLKINNINIPSGADVSGYLEQYYPIVYANLLATMNLVTYGLLTPPIVILLFRYLKSDFSQSVSAPGKFWKWFGIGFGILYGVSLVSSLFIQYVTLYLKTYIDDFKNIDTTSGNQSAINTLLNSGLYPTLVIVLMTGFLAPVLEELVFRKSFFNLSKRKGVGMIILTGAIFGSIHTVESILSIVLEMMEGAPGVSYANIVMELLNFISYFASGIALGVIYKKSNYNIWVTIFIHSVYNLIGVMAFFIV